MYTHVLELTAKPGQTGQLVRALRDHALPQVIRPSEGFVDEIVLVSDSAPNQVHRSASGGHNRMENAFTQPGSPG